MLHEDGDVRGAEQHYRLAVPSAEYGPLAQYDLGVALEDQGLADEALLAYARAIAGDATLADAHYNASRLLERMGKKADALRHLAAYRRLVSQPSSP
jgi:tetratricopeptide (TPR) repeat protein